MSKIYVKNTITWNSKVQLIISDVDETIADLYVEAIVEMVQELEKILGEGTILFLISGQSVKNIQWRITDHIRKHLRKRILTPIVERAEKLLEDKGLPITPRLAGVFAIDFAIMGVSKTTAVRYVIKHDSISLCGMVSNICMKVCSNI